MDFAETKGQLELNAINLKVRLYRRICWMFKVICGLQKAWRIKSIIMLTTRTSILHIFSLFRLISQIIYLLFRDLFVINTVLLFIFGFQMCYFYKAFFIIGKFVWLLFTRTIFMCMWFLLSQWSWLGPLPSYCVAPFNCFFKE